MARAETSTQLYFEKFLEEKFSRVFERLDTIERKSDRRDIDVNMMDTANKAESKSIKDLIEDVASRFEAITDAQDKRIQHLEWILRSFLYVIGLLAAALTWASGIWKNVRL